MWGLGNLSLKEEVQLIVAVKRRRIHWVIRKRHSRLAGSSALTIHQLFVPKYLAPHKRGWLTLCVPSFTYLPP